jgi:hypothetical protein
MKIARQVPASREVQLEAWLRTVLWLRGCGLEPVVPVDVAWRLHDLYGLRVSGPVELWTRKGHAA